ncbi:hypothetical protein FEM41_16625 [Jejubacter calystegiae]|uniref:Bacterial Ig-like domain-containing protein n=1 Tax=Jejubacter calystegiae TaxID=2579935 RepID=A0A4V1G7X4_9ENTR|nr:Ig-like domain-containing protein [Jejubacter calystegiae]QCT21157.1 hypothetical protein FEM41_16625 [Jejubacter calystegiae]
MIKTTSSLRDILGAASNTYSSEYLQSLDIVRGAELTPTVTPAEPGVVNIDTATDNTGSQQGNITNGGLTDDLTPTIGGHIDSAEGLAIRIFINTQYAGTAVVGANGDWSFTPGQPLEINHEYIFQTVIKDPGGDSLLISLPYTIYTVPTDYDVVIDRPVIDAATDNAGTIVGEVYFGGASDDTTPTFHGSADANAVVRIYDGATLLGSVQANGSGAWSFTPLTPLSGDGTHNITVRASLGNSGQEATSDTFEYILDTRGPGSLAITGAYDDVGSVTGNVPDGGVTDDKLLKLSGTAEADSIVTIHLSVNGGEYSANYMTIADSNGYWTLTMGSNPYPSTQGTMVFTATATDAVGNTSTSASYTVNLVGSNEDNPSVPDAPTIAVYYDDVGPVQGYSVSGGTTDDNTPTLNGLAAAGGVVKIYEGGMLLGSTLVENNGGWRFTPSALGNGSHVFTATVTDTVGHTSAQSGAFVINVYTADTTAPDAPVISNYYDDVGATQGYDGNGGTTDDTTPTLNGLAEANSVVRVYEGGTLLGSTIANSSGGWSFTPSTLGGGIHTFTATATDAAGNISAHSGDFAINVQASAPCVSGEFTETFNDAAAAAFCEGGVFHLEHFDISVNSSGTPCSTVRPGICNGAMVLSKDASVTLNMDHPLSWISFEVSHLVTKGEIIAAYLDENGKVLHQDVYGNVGGTTMSYVATGGEHIASVQLTAVAPMIQWWEDPSPKYIIVDNITGHYASDCSGDTFSAAAFSQMLTEDSHTIELTDGMQDKLQLTLNDILSEAHPNLFVGDGNQQLAITGDKGDVVELKVEDLSHNEWQDVGQVVTGGIQYEIYQHAASSVELLVQHGVELHQVA